MADRTCRLLIAALLASGLAGAAVAKNVALLVGVGRFANAGMDSNNRLLGTDPDLDAMQKALVEHWKFNTSDVRVLRDQEATHARILGEIAALESRSAPGDTVVLYYSGHGTSANDEDNLFDLPYATGAWIPYDFDPSNLASEQRTLVIGRRDLVGPLSKLDKAGRFVVVMSDSCFSGQVVRSIGRTHSHFRYVAMAKRDLGIASTGKAPLAGPSARLPPPPYPYLHVVLLSGASDSESGADLSSASDLIQWPTIDSRFHGAFTDALLRLMSGQLIAAPFTYAQGRDAVNTFLEGRHLVQHPQLLPGLAEDKDDVGSALFLSPFPLSSAALAAAPQAVTPPAATPSVAAPAPAAAAANTREGAVRVNVESAPPALKAAIGGLAGVAVVDRDGDLTIRQQGDLLQLLGPADDPILSTTAADPHLTKRIAAQVWLNRTLPSGSAQLGLRAETDPASRGNTFVQCETFVFEVRLEKAAYVMLLDLDPQGGLTVLYPTRASERQLIPSGAPRAIPGKELKDRIQVTAPFGTDQVAVLAFEQAPNFLVELTGAQRFEVGSGRAEFLAKGLKASSGAVAVQKIDVHTYPGNTKDSCGS